MRNFANSEKFITENAPTRRIAFVHVAQCLSITQGLANALKRPKITAAIVAFELGEYLGLPNCPVVLKIDLALKCPDLAKKILEEIDFEIPF